jgi:general secretion pathway protein H
MTPTSPRTRNDAGFTLIELLVTLVIMGLLAGLASLSVGGSATRQARDEAARFHQLLGFASDEATLQGEELGLRVEEDGYSVLRFDPENETWMPMPPTERQFAAYTLPGSVRLELTITETRELPTRESADVEEERPPEVLVLSSGEISAFRADFRAGDSTEPAASIQSDGSGTLQQE